jgi:hypothetical protein
MDDLLTKEFLPFDEYLLLLQYIVLVDFRPTLGGTYLRKRNILLHAVRQ